MRKLVGKVFSSFGYSDVFSINCDCLDPRCVHKPVYSWVTHFNDGTHCPFPYCAPLEECLRFLHFLEVNYVES